MAFRTNKVPAIEERTVSGSSVSFNSAFALPLKACKVSFSATESGTGEKSPSNPYTISGVSSLDLSANSVPVSVNFGDSYYGGELDLLTGKLTVTEEHIILKGASWESYTSNGGRKGFLLNLDAMKIGSFQQGVCDKLNTLYSDNTGNVTGIIFGISNRIMFFTGIVGTYIVNQDVTEWKTWLSNNNLDIVYPIKNPFEVQLSPTELSSILGNNTFSTDTGTLEITFADLQEKSASGSVASFNTALAMPLVNSEFTIQAYQEGSGDSSPDNIRNIVGYSALNITKTGKNTFKTDGLIYAEPSSTDWEPTNKRVFVPNSYCLGLGGNGYYSYANQYFTNYTVSNNLIKLKKSLLFNYGIAIPILDLKEGQEYTISAVCQNGNIAILWYADDGTLISRTTSITTYNVFTVPSGCKFTVFSFGATANDVEATFTDIQLEVGSQATAYEPYVTPTIYTKSLGETVYGGSYNSATGDKIKTWLMASVDGSENWVEYQAGKYYIEDVFPRNVIQLGQNLGQMSNYYLFSGNGATASSMVTTDHRIYAQTAYGRIWIYDSDYTLAELKAKFNETSLQLILPLLSDYYEINNIGATPISTNIGDNTIFADSGDVAVVFNDLDIAKRGNFREVFKLPS